MNICKKEQEKSFIKGNLYKVKNNEYIFMYTGEYKGVCLNTGQNNVDMTVLTFWENVTDKYCLKEI